MIKEKSMAALINRFHASFGGDCQRLHEAILAGPGSQDSHVIQFAASQFGEGSFWAAFKALSGSSSWKGTSGNRLSMTYLG